MKEKLRDWKNWFNRKNSDYYPTQTTILKRSYTGIWERSSKMDTEHVFICLERTSFCEEYYGKPFKVRQHFMKKLCEKANVKQFGFHSIRHLVATILYHKGSSLSEIQAFLRHKSPATTEKYLRSLGLKHVRKVLEEGLSSPRKSPNERLNSPAKIIPFPQSRAGGKIKSKG